MKTGMNPQIPSIGIDSLQPRQARDATPQGVSNDDFKKQLESLQKVRQDKKAETSSEKLKFSNHAIERMQRRGVQFTTDQIDKIESAVQKAAAKGARETLLLTDDAALIVSVKDKTVVTVMDKAALKENVFTNIDSTVMI